MSSEVAKLDVDTVLARPEHMRSKLISSYQSLLTEARRLLVAIEARKDFDLQHTDASYNERLAINDERMKELTAALNTVAEENRELVIAKAKDRKAIEEEFERNASIQRLIIRTQQEAIAGLSENP